MYLVLGSISIALKLHAQRVTGLHGVVSVPPLDIFNKEDSLTCFRVHWFFYLLPVELAIRVNDSLYAARGAQRFHCTAKLLSLQAKPKK
jgi:hypothetical protein